MSEAIQKLPEHIYLWGQHLTSKSPYEIMVEHVSEEESVQLIREQFSKEESREQSEVLYIRAVALAITRGLPLFISSEFIQLYLSEQQ